MQQRRNLPFQDLSKEAWQNLVIAAFLAFYAGQVVFDAAWKNYCGNLAIDYCAFWSAGKIANIDGYEQVYNLDRLWEIQKPNKSEHMSPEQYAPVPVPYLLIFITPFQLFALLDVIPGFWLWTVLNITGTIAYLLFFTRKTGGTEPIRIRTLLLVLISLPVFLNLFQGQVNAWLMICTGEFLRKLMDDEPFQAGLWLGGLLLKPQILILILPALLFKRSFSTIFGFALSSLGLGLASLVLGGWTAFQRLIQLLIGYTGGLPSNYPESMVNWRMVAYNINALFSSNIGWWIAIPGLIATVIFALYTWRFPVPPRSTQFTVAILGTFAATSAIAWHSHFSMMMLMIPILLYLISRGVLPEKLFLFWIFMPPILMLAAYIFAPIIKVGLLPDSLYPVLNLSSGLRGLILNVYLLWWTTAYLKKHFANSP